MFESGMKESNASIVPIKKTDGNMFKVIVKFLYTGIPPEDLKEIAFDLLPLADRYDVAFLKNAAAAAIAKDLTVETAVRAAVLAEEHSCDPLKGPALRFIKEHLSDALKDPRWVDLCYYPTVVAKIFHFE